MVKRVIIGKPEEAGARLVELLKGARETATQGSTVPAGNKVLEDDENFYWSRPDGSSHSMREVDEGLALAEGRIEEAEQSLADSQVRLDDAEQQIQTTQSGLDTLENQTLPAAVEALEQADAAAQEQFAELDTRLGDFATDEALAPIRQALQDAQTAVETAQGVAETANQAANAASQAALEAAGIAASKGRVIIQETEPVGEDRNAANIWIKPIPDDPETEIEEKAITYVYLEGSNEWVPTSSDELAQAAQNALDAREAASQAKQRADTAISNAAAAQAAASAAQQTADQATLDAREAHNEAVAATERAQALMEAGESLLVNGGFEQGALGWEPHGSRTEIAETTDAYAGTHVLRITPHAANTYPYADPVATATGRTYRIAYMIRHDGQDPTGRIRQYNMITKADGSRQGQFQSDWYEAGEFEAGTWNRVTFDLTVTVEDAARIQFAPHLSISPNTYDIDEFRAVDITEALAAKVAAQEAWDRADAAMTEAESKATPEQVQAAANAAETAAKTAAAADAKAKADQAKADALAGAATDATSKAAAAEAAAVAEASRDAAAKANKALQDALAALATARGEITDEIKASANGKNSITISTSAPSGRGVAIGDTWWRVDASGDIYGQWMWNGSWVPREIRSEVIANLDVHKLQVTGSAKMDEAVIDKLWVDGIAAKAITAQQVTVAPGNSFPDPSGLNVGTRNSVGGSAWSWDDAGKYWKRAAATGGTTQFNAYLNTTTGYDSGSLTPGETYRIAYDIWVEGGTGSGGTGRTAIYYRKMDGSTSFVADGKTAVAVAKGRWVHIEREWVAPADAISGGFAPQLLSTSATATEVRIRNVFIGPKVGAVLIQDGAITTPKLTVTEDMSAAIVSAMSVNTKKLVVSEEAILNHATLIGQTVVDDINVQGKLIGTDGVFTGTVDFENVNVTGLQLVEKLEAHSISADLIEGGAFTGESFTGGTFVGGEFRTSDTLPGQVTLSDGALSTSLNTATGPGIRITPEDTSGFEYMPGIGPSTAGLMIYGGKRVDTGASIVQANPTGSFMRTFREDGTYGGEIQTTPTASLMRTYREGGTTGGVIQTSPTASFMRTYREDGTNGGEIHSSPTASLMRTYREDGTAGGLVQTSPTASLMRTYSGNSSEAGWVQVRPQDAELAYVDTNNTYFSRIKADASEAFIYTRAGGTTRYLTVDADGVWVKTNKGGSWKQYNLEETAQDSGWNSFPVKGGLKGVDVAWRNKGGVCHFKGHVYGTYSAGWNAIVTGLPKEMRPAQQMLRAGASSTTDPILRMSPNGALEVHIPSKWTGNLHLSPLSYVIG